MTQWTWQQVALVALKAAHFESSLRISLSSRSVLDCTFSHDSGPTDAAFVASGFILIFFKKKQKM